MLSFRSIETLAVSERGSLANLSLVYVDNWLRQPRALKMHYHAMMYVRNTRRYLFPLRSVTRALTIALIVWASNVLPANGLDSHDKAAAEIAKLGGSVTRIASNSDDCQVDFSLGGRELTNEGLVHLSSLENVVALNLKRTKITSDGLVHLKRLTKLRPSSLPRTKPLLLTLDKNSLIL